MSLNDELHSALRLDGFTGALNDMMFSDLRSQGFTGALPDMMTEFGGWQLYFENILGTLLSGSLLIESGERLLLEDGFEIILE